jgi:hypothetical protein
MAQRPPLLAIAAALLLLAAALPLTPAKADSCGRGTTKLATGECGAFEAWPHRSMCGEDFELAGTARVLLSQRIQPLGRCGHTHHSTLVIAGGNVGCFHPPA